MIWSPYDWLNKFYSLYIAAVIDIVSRCGLRIEVDHRNQPIKAKLVLCMAVTFTLRVCIVTVVHR